MLDPAVPSPPWGPHHGDTQVRLKTIIVPSAAQTQELYFFSEDSAHWILGAYSPCKSPNLWKTIHRIIIIYEYFLSAPF